jgi:uncharacterized membrane protein
MSDPAAEPVLFDALLTPHRSLSPRGFALLMAIAGLVGFGFGAAFLVMGAWPIFGFCGAEWLLFYVCFRLNYRAARMRERVRLTPGLLTVERRDPRGKTQSWSFQPYWLRVEMDDPPEHGSQLSLASHGKRLTIGSFLSPPERQDLAEARAGPGPRQAGARRRLSGGPPPPQPHPSMGTGPPLGPAAATMSCCCSSRPCGAGPSC